MSAKNSLMTEALRITVPTLILAAGIGGFLVFGQRPEVPKKEVQENRAVKIETAVIENFDGTIVIKAEGVAVPYRQIAVSAEVAGRIVYKSDRCQSGRYVKQQPTRKPTEKSVDRASDLIRIDTTDYQLEIDRLHAQRLQPEAEIAAADVDIANTKPLIETADRQWMLKKKELSRYEQLARQNSLTEKELDDARQSELAASSSLQTLKKQQAQHQQKKITLKASLMLIDAQLKRARVDLARTRVGAAIDGTIVTAFFEQNDYVKKGEPLFKINDTTRAEVRCNLRLDDVYWVWLQSGLYAPGKKPNRSASQFEIPDTAVDVVFAFNGVEYIWDGKLARYEGGGLDPTTRTVPCRISISEPTNVRVGKASTSPAALVPPTLFTGMYVQIRIPIRSPIPLLKVPTAAIRPGNKIWLDDDGQLRILAVNVVRSVKGDTYIRRPSDGRLKPGQHVITSPLASAIESMRVSRDQVK